jgi:hypothetical protein
MGSPWSIFKVATRSKGQRSSSAHTTADGYYLPPCCARAARSRVMRSSTSLWSQGLFSIGPTSHSSAALRTVRSGVPASSIFNSGRMERAHCAKPKPFIDPGISISLSTTSTGKSVFCRIAMAFVGGGRFNDTIAAVAEELHDGHRPRCRHQGRARSYCWQACCCGRACSCQMLRSRQLIGRGGKVKRVRLSLVPGAAIETAGGVGRAIMRSSQCGPKNGQSAHRRPSKHLPRRRTVVIMRNGAAWRNRPEGDHVMSTCEIALSTRISALAG